MNPLSEIQEIARYATPGPEPLGIAFHEGALWISSREAHRLYALDRARWSILEDVATPGAPFGIAVGSDGFRLVIGYGHDDDDRYIFRFVPGRGFDRNGIACPDLSGVHLAFAGDTLYLSQAHNKRVLALSSDGTILRDIPLGRRPVGMTTVEGRFYFTTVDDAWQTPQFATLNINDETPHLTALAWLPFGGRALAFDGSRFWTGDRRQGEIVAFTLPA